MCQTPYLDSVQEDYMTVQGVSDRYPGLTNIQRQQTCVQHEPETHLGLSILTAQSLWCSNIMVNKSIVSKLHAFLPYFICCDYENAPSLTL